MMLDFSSGNWIFMSTKLNGLLRFHSPSPTSSISPWMPSSCNSHNQFLQVYWFGLVWFGLCCFLTPGLGKDILCHVWPYFFWTCKSPGQIFGHTKSGLSARWLHMVTSIFLRGLCGYVWVNILTLSLQRVKFIELMGCTNLFMHKKQTASCKMRDDTSGNATCMGKHVVWLQGI